MSKLLSANFSRLFRSRLFWLHILIMFALSVMTSLFSVNELYALVDTSPFTAIQMLFSGTPNPYLDMLGGPDTVYFGAVPSYGLLYAVFISLFLGTEYSDSTIRNKLIVGYTRTQVYLSFLIVSVCASVLLLSAALIGNLCVLPFLGVWRMGLPKCGMLILICFLFTVAFAAIFTLIALSISSKAASDVFSILLFLALLLIVSILSSRLHEPELTSNFIITAEGQPMLTDSRPNPYYVSGFLRHVYEFLVIFLPTGQSIQVSDMDVSNCLPMILSSLFIFVSVSVGGIFVFHRKDLK